MDHKHIHLVLCVAIVCVGCVCASITKACMQCICQVESGCNPGEGCNMDVGSLSCGPYQIKKVYWEDCGKPGKDFKTCATDMNCAEKCVETYMDRYGPKCAHKANPSCEVYARIHNGGPTGCSKNATISYWNKVKKCCVGKPC